MADPTHPVTQVLLTILDNQIDRIDAAYDNLDGETFTVEPGGDCNSIQRITHHLVHLRRFQLMLLESPKADDIELPEQYETVAEGTGALREATDLLREAIAAHDPGDWYALPTEPREGIWGELPTIERFVRPLNDLTNHLGAIRAIRRISNRGNDRTQ